MIEVECRTCLEMSNLETFSSMTKKSLLGKPFKDAIHHFVPQMVTSIWTDDSICCTCSETLDTFSNFIERCVENILNIKKLNRNNITEETSILKLLLLNRYNNEDNLTLQLTEPIWEECRTCLKDTNLESSTSIVQEFLLGKTFKDVILQFVPEMITSIRINDILCFKCVKTLHDFANFIKRCIEIEEILQTRNKVEENGDGRIEEVNRQLYKNKKFPKFSFLPKAYNGNKTGFGLKAIENSEELPAPSSFGYIETGKTDLPDKSKLKSEKPVNNIVKKARKINSRVKSPKKCQKDPIIKSQIRNEEICGLPDVNEVITLTDQTREGKYDTCNILPSDCDNNLLAIKKQNIVQGFTTRLHSYITNLFDPTITAIDNEANIKNTIEAHQVCAEKDGKSHVQQNGIAENKLLKFIKIIEAPQVRAEKDGKSYVQQNVIAENKLLKRIKRTLPNRILTVHSKNKFPRTFFTDLSKSKIYTYIFGTPTGSGNKRILLLGSVMYRCPKCNKEVLSKSFNNHLKKDKCLKDSPISAIKEEIPGKTLNNHLKNDKCLENSPISVIREENLSTVEDPARSSSQSYLKVTKSKKTYTRDKSIIMNCKEPTIKSLQFLRNDENVIIPDTNKSVQLTNETKENRKCENCGRLFTSDCSNNMPVMTRCEKCSLIEQEDTRTCNTSNSFSTDVGNVHLIPTTENCRVQSEKDDRNNLEKLEDMERFNFVRGTSLEHYPVRNYDRIISVCCSNEIPLNLLDEFARSNIQTYHYGVPKKINNKRILLFGSVIEQCLKCCLKMTDQDLETHFKQVHSDEKLPRLQQNPSYDHILRPIEKDMPQIGRDVVYVYDHISTQQRDHKKIGNQCTICRVNFASVYILRRHLFKYHPDYIFHKCDNCNQGFRRVEPFKCHVRRFQEFGSCNMRKCTVCSEIFTVNKAGYSSHMKIHKKTKPRPQRKGDKTRQLLCHVCGKVLRRLREHLRIHNITLNSTLNRKYMCHKCPKRYKTQRALNVHIRNSHKNFKKFECSLCKRRCSMMETLKRHYLLKHPEKCDMFNYSHICNICGKKFFRRDYFQRHMRKHAQGGKFRKNFSKRNRHPKTSGV